jgi:glutamate-1-semialdehyde 2,1-aminomutase
MSRSVELFQKACQVIPGGVNSPVRAFKGVGGDPVYFQSGKGAYLYDVDGQTYIDYIGSWGPMILGHAHPEVVEATIRTLENGASFGAPCELEIQLAEKICHLMPNIEKVRLLNSGTEATMTAIRLARAATGREKIIKFAGCFHGHSDALLVKAGSGLLTLGVPSTPGVPVNTAQNTLTAPFNDLESVRALFESYRNEIAGMIVEPIAGNMGMVLPEPNFLAGLRALCDEYQAVLIFDEVMTGFRVALGGAQSLYPVKPDLTTLGKIIGGGLPVGAVGGKAEIMNLLSPLGSVYQSGTFAGNPLTMSSGLTTLDILQRPGTYERLNQRLQKLMNGMQDLAQEFDIDLQTVHVGGMFGLYFTKYCPVRCYEDVARGDELFFKRFFHLMLKQGVYLAPSMYEAGFISTAHTDEDIVKTLNAVKKAFEYEQKIPQNS